MACPSANFQPYVDWLQQSPSMAIVHMVGVQIEDRNEQLQSTFTGRLAYAPAPSFGPPPRLNHLYGSAHDIDNPGTRIDVYLGLPDHADVVVHLSYWSQASGWLSDVALQNVTCSSGNTLRLGGDGDNGHTYGITLARDESVHNPIHLR